MTDLSDEAIRAYAANLFDLEDAREAAQDDLKAAWASIREAQGKKFADSFKLAIKRARMDADKRNAADEVDAEAERIMSVLASRAPRATHAIASSVPKHDADGVIIESTAARKDVPVSEAPGVSISDKETPAGTQAPPVDTNSLRVNADMPGNDDGPTSSAGTEGEADRQPIPDISKPNPICRDPDDCGVYASWHMPCLNCQRAASLRNAA